MTARYTRAEFAEAGLEPGPCDGLEVKWPRQPGYWIVSRIVGLGR